MSTRYMFWCITMFALVFSACEADLEPQELLKESPVTNFTTQVKYTDSTEIKTITFTGGRRRSTELPTTYVFTGAKTLVDDLGSKLVISGTQVNIIQELYRLQFWGNDLPVDRLLTVSEIEEFFVPGRSFAFGSGEDKVDLGILLPLRELYDNRLSRPVFLANPSGELSVESIEDYDYPIYNYTSQPNEHSYGKLITCSFNGQIGRYDGLADQADGDPSFYQTDEVVELIDGKVTFYLEYERI